jgi:Mg2+ and Co2+ transporter CorA
MGVLAIFAVASSVYPTLFDVSDRQDRFLDWVEWAIVLAFVAEYLIHLALAGDRKAYVLSGWRLLDLGVIVACTLTLIPAIDDSFRRVLALRLLRIIRAFAFGLRVKSALGREHAAPSSQAPAPVPRTFSVLWEDTWKSLPLEWQEFVARSATRGGGWLDAYDVGARHLEELAATMKLPPALFSILRSASAYPRLKVIGKRLVATLWLPLVKQGESQEIERVCVLLSLSEHEPMVTIAPTDCQLRQRMSRWLPPQASPSVAEAGEAYFRMVLEQNEEALAHLEVSLRQMEEVPVARVGEEFFRLAFRLRRDLSQVKADLWRLGGILDTVKTGRLDLPGQVKAGDEAFLVLSDQADYLYETASNLREELLSLIELHMNTTSFQMNRFMQLLAVVTVLAAIPATVGGLLGMNILGNPWPVTLGQVTFGVALGVLTVLYLFLSGKYLR